MALIIKNKVLILSLISAIILLAIWAAIKIIGDSSGRESFKEVLSTMSTNKAKRFFEDHPDSPYKDMLVNEIIKWCDNENTQECYEMILSVIPKNHVRYKELADRYKQSFDKKK